MDEFASKLKVEYGLEVPGELLALALTHPSAVGEGLERTQKSNQRLEFLGDALLGAIVAEHFYRTEPNLPEGQLTARKIASVRREALASAAQRLNLGQYLNFGRGEDAAGGRERASNLSDAFEAVVGAIFLGSGWEAAREFVGKALGPELAIDPQKLVPAKNRLQELTQAVGLGTPSYRTGATGATAHHFSSEVILNGEVRGRGQGGSKKAAEEVAAEATLNEILAATAATEEPPA